MAGTRRSPSKHAKTIRDEIEQRRKDAAGKNQQFTGLTDDQIRRKLRKAKSPMIIWQSWGPAPPGGTVNYTVGIFNPDPTAVIWLLVHLFVGAANIVADANDALADVDPRFARLTQPDFPGLSVAPGANQSLSFQLPVPGSVEKTNYLGNAFLFRATWHDAGVYEDRGLFLFKVS
jgi:hypothetical protein